MASLSEDSAICEYGGDRRYTRRSVNKAVHCKQEDM